MTDTANEWETQYDKEEADWRAEEQDILRRKMDELQPEDFPTQPL